MSMYLPKTVYLLICLLAIVCGCKEKKSAPEQVINSDYFVTPLGKKYMLPEPSEELMVQYREARDKYLRDPGNADNTIWYGRRTAYLGRYEDAIGIYTDGIQKFPEDARFYRHRGHRYITLRKFEEAVKDLEKAGSLIDGMPDTIEPDGMPNARNIPVSTLHTNIWYHLGLAYYLKHEYQSAFDAYSKCRATGSNADNMVSSTHWLYMIQRRLGNSELALKVLDPIPPDSVVIENMVYDKLCKFYKGIIPVDSLATQELVASASDAINYGLANWYFYTDDKPKSETLLHDIIEGNAWNSFGYIAAESDLLYYFNPK